MTDTRQGAAASRARVIAAFAAVYLIWGSTYLAIRYAIETLPPFLMAGSRFLIAGAILYGWTRLRGAGRPTRVEWRAAAIVGGLLLLGGNGLVVWSEQWVPSGMAALLVATEPLWIVVLDWLRPGGRRPGAGVIAGVLVGFGGIALLVGPGEWAGGEGVYLVGAAALVIAALSWAAGSIYSLNAKLPSSPPLATGMEMLAGGALLTVAGLLSGEVGSVDPAAVSAVSLGALLYLIVFGSLIGFSAYVWLLGVCAPARVATYAYVNPVVAVLLGWAVAGEPLTPRIGIAVAVIVGAVALITARRAETAHEPVSAPPALAVGTPRTGAAVGTRLRAAFHRRRAKRRRRVGAGSAS